MIRKVFYVSISVLLILILSRCGKESTIEHESEPYLSEILRPEFPDCFFNITDYGADNGTFDLNTSAINSTILKCSQSGGGYVIIPEGIWLTGPIQLQNNVNLKIEKGAIVVFSKNFEDYPYIESCFAGKSVIQSMPMLYGDGLNNIAITGKGVFDGSGNVWRPVKKNKSSESQWQKLVNSGGVLSKEGTVWWPNEYAYRVSRDPDHFRKIFKDLPNRDFYKAYFRPPLVQLVSCSKVLLEGPVFQNSPGWCIHPLMCEHLTVTDITVKTPRYAQNGDGIKIESCNHVAISYSGFDVGDMAICIESGKGIEVQKRSISTQNVLVENCLVHHGHRGFVVGSEVSGGIKNILVRNCTFIGTDVSLMFKSKRGHGGVVENIKIENIRMVDIKNDAILFNLFYDGLVPSKMKNDTFANHMEQLPQALDEIPEFKNISLKNINCIGASSAMKVMGLPEMPIQGIRLENSFFQTKKGVNCLYTNKFNIKNVILHTEENPSVLLKNVAGATIDSCICNREVALQIEGPLSKNILVCTEDIIRTKLKTVLGKELDESILSFHIPEVK